MVKWIRIVDWYVHAAMIVSIGMGIAAFCTPPLATIDRSILAFIAEITGAAAVLTFLIKLPEYIEKGASVKIQRGNTSIEASRKNKPHRGIDEEKNDDESD